VESAEVRAPSREAGDDTTGKVDLEAAIPVSSFAVTGAGTGGGDGGGERAPAATETDLD